MWGMTRRAWIVGAALAVALVAASAEFVSSRPAADLPSRLPDRDFWQIVERFSEPDGYFDSDNLVSNEDAFQSVVPELATTVRPGGAYIGVGPDQNFTYILAVKPAVAFITDIRRGNLHVQLMYKALFEMSADRAEFLAHLFGRPRPAGLEADTRIADLMRVYRAVPGDAARRSESARLLIDRLTAAGRFGLRPADVAAIRSVHAQFAAAGPDLRFVSSRGGNWYPTLMELQLATDGRGVEHGYLATEERYRRLRAMQQANLIVPVVGDLAGPKALREIGRYVAAHGETVGTLYTSNVERYLFRDGAWPAFLANVRSLPIGPTSTVIRSCFDSCSSAGESRAVTLLDSMPALVADAASGRVASYWDVLARSRRPRP
jgi:hypothetical protein